MPTEYLKKGVVGINHQRMPLLAIVGPTATGKTDLSVYIAQKLNAEIISADSMLVYRHMDIGTAKPSLEEKKGVQHHMIDIVDPDETFNVSIYSQAVKNLLTDFWQKNTLPILVGGTGLYVQAVIDGYSFGNTGHDQELRDRLMHECKTMGKAALHEKLKTIDPDTASRLHINNIQRVIRALEVYYLSGIKPSEMAGKEEGQFNLLMYGLTMSREILYSRIEKRVDKMVAAGLVEEVKFLLKRGYSQGLTAMQGLGYKEIVQYLNGELSLEDAINLLKRNTRRFAKRQFTWFRRDKRIKWIDVGNQKTEEVQLEIALEAEGVFKLSSNEY